MSVEIIKDGKTIRTSKNLRGLLEYWRHTSVDKVKIIRCGDGAIALVWFADSAFCCTDFASFRVASEWFDKRIARRGGKLTLIH